MNFKNNINQAIFFSRKRLQLHKKWKSFFFLWIFHIISGIVNLTDSVIFLKFTIFFFHQILQPTKNLLALYYGRSHFDSCKLDSCKLVICLNILWSYLYKPQYRQSSPILLSLSPFLSLLILETYQSSHLCFMVWFTW